jgi:hypothetical protein
MYRLNHNQDIIELLEKLREFRADYPAELLLARRLSFVSLVNRYIIALM